MPIFHFWFSHIKIISQNSNIEKQITQNDNIVCVSICIHLVYIVLLKLSIQLYTLQSLFIASLKLSLHCTLTCLWNPLQALPYYYWENLSIVTKPKHSFAKLVLSCFIYLTSCVLLIQCSYSYVVIEAQTVLTENLSDINTRLLSIHRFILTLLHLSQGSTRILPRSPIHS